MAVITTGNHPKALWPGVEAFFGQTGYNRREQWKDLVEVRTSDKNYEELVQNTGFGLAPVKQQGASISYDQTNQGYIARFTHVVYGLGYIVTREEIEDNLYEKVSMDRAQSLKISMMETKENVVANILNRGFSASYTGGDAVALFSASHPTQAGNQSNLLATAADLSEASLEDMLIQISGAQDFRGNRISLQAQKLIVSRSDVFNAARILKSTQQNDTANNAINAINALNMLPEGVVMNQYLTDQDAWFVKTNAPNSILLFQRRALEFTKDNDFGTENALAKATERYSVGWADWHGMYGTAGA